MKRIIYALIAVALISCKKDKTTVITPTVTQVQEQEIHTDWYGSWVGNFNAEKYNENSEDVSYVNKISIVIKKITSDIVTGQSVVAGNSRPLTGTISGTDNNAFVLKEPGDNKYDGTFTFRIDGDTLSGKWISNNKKVTVTERSFKLVKKQFTYYPQLMLPEERDYIDYSHTKTEEIVEEDGTVSNENLYRQASESVRTINASTQELTEDQLKNLKKLDLEIIRNTIFARHGYTFKKKSVRQFFDPVDWYVPVSEDVSADLTKLEKDNIVLLKRFEKYAEDNYDSFGR